MQKHFYSLFIVGVILLCANFSSQDSTIAGGEKPPINFYGKLTDSTGQTYDVENITISNMYRQVPVYKEPNDKNIDPSINITRLDFAEIYSITVPHQNEVLTFNNRQYITLEVTSSDSQKTKQTYIIERSKRVICDEVNTAGAIEKDLAFQAVDTLVFAGHKESKTETSQTTSAIKSTTPTTTKKIETSAPAA